MSRMPLTIRTTVTALTVLTAATLPTLQAQTPERVSLTGTRVGIWNVAGKVTMDVQDALTSGDRAKGLILACQARAMKDVIVDA